MYPKSPSQFFFWEGSHFIRESKDKSSWSQGSSTWYGWVWFYICLTYKSIWEFNNFRKFIIKGLSLWHPSKQMASMDSYRNLTAMLTFLSAWGLRGRSLPAFVSAVFSCEKNLSKRWLSGKWVSVFCSIPILESPQRSFETCSSPSQINQ